MSNLTETSTPLRVFIITQDEPFFLAQAIDYLFSILPKSVNVTGAYVLSGSPFGKRKSFAERALLTYQIFGLRFFLFYASQLVFSRLFRVSVRDVLSKHVARVRTGPIRINAKESIDEIKSHEPDIIISLASNQIFHDQLLQVPKRACLNLHTAMLPKYRGLMPLFWAMANGDEEIGVTVFEMDAGLDSGPIIQQAEVPVAAHSMHQLIGQTKYLGMMLVARALEDYQTDSVTRRPNRDELSTRVTFPTAEDTAAFRAQGRRFF